MKRLHESLARLQDDPTYGSPEAREAAGLRPAVDDAVAAEDLQEWLQIEPGGELEVVSKLASANAAMLTYAVLVAWVMGVGLPILILRELFGGLPTPLWFLYGLSTITAVVQAWRRFHLATIVRAGVEGLSVRRFGRWRTYAWAEVQSVIEGSIETRSGDKKVVQRVYLVQTDQGRFSFVAEAEHAPRVALAIRAVAQARREGVELPTDRPVSEAAVSLAEPADADTARGLSRTDA